MIKGTLEHRAFMTGYMAGGLRKKASDATGAQVGSAGLGVLHDALDMRVNPELANYAVKGGVGVGAQLIANKLLPEDLKAKYPMLTSIAPGVLAALMTPDAIPEKVS